MTGDQIVSSPLDLDRNYSFPASDLPRSNTGNHPYFVVYSNPEQGIGPSTLKTCRCG